MAGYSRTGKQSCNSTACENMSSNSDISNNEEESQPIALSQKKENPVDQSQSLLAKSIHNETLQTQAENSSSSQSNSSYALASNAAYNNCSNVNGSVPTGGLSTQHYYSQILNNPQSLLRPLMTTQPPLYSPILPPQQHSYALPHPSPSSNCYSSLQDSVRNLESLQCSSDATSRFTGENSTGTEKSCNLQNPPKQFSVDDNQKRIPNQNSCNLSRYSSCAEIVTKHNNLAEQQQVFEEYVRIYGEDISCRSWGESSSNSAQPSTHRNNYNSHSSSNSGSINVHGYSDCRLDQSWNRYISGQSTNYMPEAYPADNNSFSKHLIKGYNSVSNNGNSNMSNSVADHNLSRSHYEYSVLSAGQLASILTTYMQPVNYQTSQDCRNECRATDLRTSENDCQVNNNTVPTTTPSEVSDKKLSERASQINSATSSSQAIAIPNNGNGESSTMPISSNGTPNRSNELQTSHSLTLQEYQGNENSSSKDVPKEKKSKDSSQLSVQSTSNCQSNSNKYSNKNTIERETLGNFNKKQSKMLNEGVNMSFFCFLCGEAVNDSPTHSMIDNIITFASKISVNDKLTMMIGYPLPRDMLPSLSICPKCFRLINEVDMLENRLNMCRREVLFSIESMFERNGIHVSPYKRFQRQQHVGPYQHDVQHTSYHQSLGSNVNSHSVASNYQNDSQNYQSLNHIYTFHNQGNVANDMHQNQMHHSQTYNQHNGSIHSSISHSHQGQEQTQLNSDLSNHQGSISNIHHSANQMQGNSHKVHAQHNLNKLPMENNHLKQQHQNQHHLESAPSQVPTQQGNQQQQQHPSHHHHHHHHHQVLNHQHTTLNVHNQYHQQQSGQHSDIISSNPTHSVPQESSQLQSETSRHSQHYSKQDESITYHHSQIDHNHHYETTPQVLQANQTHISDNSKPNNTTPHHQEINAYHQQQNVSNVPPSLSEKSSTSAEHDLQSDDVTQSPVLTETLHEKGKAKENNSENQSLLLDNSNQMPLILPETSSDIDTHQMSVLLSYQQSSGPGRSLNTELLEVNNFDQSYGNVDNIDSTTVNSLHAGKSVDKHDDGGADLNEKEFSKTQNIDVENWPSCNNSAMERANESIASNHPECDIDIEECDIIKNVSDNETPVCSNEMFNKNEISIPDIGQQADNDNTSFETENKESDTHVKTDEVQLNPRTSEPNDLDILLQSPLSPPPPPIGPPEGLRNVQDATEYHKPTLLGKNIKVKKHAKLQICRQCDQVFSNRQALIRHIERRHKNFTLNHSCDTCHKKFNSERTLNQHMRSHKTYPCKLCSKIFLKKQKLKKHMEDHSQKNLSCKICGREAGSMPALISHVKSHERLPKNFTCSVCSKHFTCKRNLEQHTLIHSGEKPFSCENCGRVFRNRSNMVNHFNICTGKYRFTCSLCGKGFVLKSQYERHLGEHEGRYAHCCSICQKGFSKSSDLRIHFNTHEIALQAHTKLCTVCTNQEFGCNAANIKETKTVCEICGKHINKKSTMKDHLAFHAGKRNYECHICSMSYFYKSNLTFHIKSVHEKKTPFQCSTCSKTFSRHSSYKLHIRTHTGEKPYQCKHCGKAFSSGSNYKRHLKCHVTHVQFESEERCIDDINLL